MQVCAQALCLEEMLGLEVAEGSVFHAKSQKRRTVPMTRELREETEAAVARLHKLIRSAAIPPAVPKPQCRGCSLRGLCLPEAFAMPSRTADLARDLFRPESSDPT